jgi:hypothetical protein
MVCECAQRKQSIEVTKKLVKHMKYVYFSRYQSAKNNKKYSYGAGAEGSSRVLTIRIVQSGLGYVTDGEDVGNVAGLFLYLRTQGVTNENLLKAAEGLARCGAYTVQQE